MEIRVYSGELRKGSEVNQGETKQGKEEQSEDSDKTKHQ